MTPVIAARGPGLRAQIGYLPGDFTLAERSTGHVYLAELAQISGAVAPRTIEALAERLGVDLRRKVHTLSKGNRQKLGLIQAFMHTPKLLILEEPTSGLDPLMQREFLAMVREARENGQTEVLSSHILSEIQQVTDDVAVLNKGRIVAQGGVVDPELDNVVQMRAVLDAGYAAETAAVEQALTAVPGLADLDVDASAGVLRVHATIRGDVDAMVKTLARFTVRELTISEPELEESILGLYSERTDVRLPGSAPFAALHVARAARLIGRYRRCRRALPSALSLDARARARRDGQLPGHRVGAGAELRPDRQRRGLHAGDDLRAHWLCA